MKKVLACIYNQKKSKTNRRSKIMKLNIYSMLYIMALDYNKIYIAKERLNLNKRYKKATRLLSILIYNNMILMVKSMYMSITYYILLESC